MFTEMALDASKQWKQEISDLVETLNLPREKKIISFSADEREKLKYILRNASRKPYSKGLIFQPYIEGSWAISSHLLGTVNFEGQDYTVDDLLAFICDKFLERFYAMKPWKVFQYFFNQGAKVKIVFDTGFPGISFTKSVIILTDQWNRYQETAIEKNARKIRFRYDALMKHPSPAALQKIFASRSYGVLNSCFSNARFESARFATLEDTDNNIKSFRVGEGIVKTLDGKLYEVIENA